MDPPYIAALVQSAALLRGSMPPFLGTPAEASLIADHLARHTDRRPLDAICAERGEDLASRAYRQRCGVCHVPGAAGDVSASFADLSAGDVMDMLDSAADLGVGMPAYTGTGAEREALVEYLVDAGKRKAARQP
jgi:hypothetical protein